MRPVQLRQTEWLGSDLRRFRDFIAREMPTAVSGRPTSIGSIRYKDPAPIRRDPQFPGSLGHVSVEDAFLTAVAPASTAYDGVNEFYPTDKEYVFVLADALREEYLEISNSGLLLEVHDAVLANIYDHWLRQSPQQYRQWAQLRVDALNHVLRGIPEDRIRYHVCFGSWHVPTWLTRHWEVVEFILQVNAGAYAIESANPRHEHEWRVWRNGRLPKGKILIPGVITHHLVTVEHSRLVADRIIRYAELVGPSNVLAGTDCGFAQMDVIERVPAEIMWAKFESLVRERGDEIRRDPQAGQSRMGAGPGPWAGHRRGRSPHQGEGRAGPDRLGQLEADTGASGTRAR